MSRAKLALQASYKVKFLKKSNTSVIKKDVLMNKFSSYITGNATSVIFCLEMGGGRRLAQSRRGTL
jgi:hypothetical protein